MKKQLFLVIAFSLFAITTLNFYGCRKEKNNDDNNNSETVFNNSTRTKASFVGQIVKEDGTPLEGGVVSLESNQITTDADGFFYFSNVNVPQNAALIKVSKNGYFDAFRTIHVIPNKDNHVKIMIMNRPAPATFNAALGGTINITGGGSLNIPAGAIIDPSTNQTYNGSVNVYSKWIDPSAQNLAFIMPGDLRGITTNNYEQGLTTYGMHIVELEGASGQKLQLGNGMKAKIYFPVPSSMRSSAPAEIPLWHFDENIGLWIEDGKAVLQNNEYFGEVSHFSYWNCDYGGPIVNFTCTLVDAGYNPISGCHVKLTPQSSTLTPRTAITNSSGVVSGGISVNTSFNLEYFPSGCNSTGTPIFIQSFSSVTSNINLGTIVVSNISSNVVTINGVVQDCNSNPLANAPVKILIGSNIYPLTTNASGSFSTSLNCINNATPATITGYDVTNAVSGSSSVTIPTSGIYYAGIIPACGNLFDFITLTGMNGSTPININITEPNGNMSQDYSPITFIIGYNPSPYQFISFSFDGPQTVAGTHNLVSYYDSNDSISSFTPAIINLSQYGPVGGKVAGSFSTVANGDLYNNATINVNFRVTRHN